MIWWSFASVSSKPHDARPALCCISSAEVATPPAFAALAGPKSTPAERKTCTPSGVVDMFAAAQTSGLGFPSRFGALLVVVWFGRADPAAGSEAVGQWFVPGVD